jgi:hypothetical protein
MHQNITFEFRNRQWLYQKYVVERLNGFQIARFCNCHPRTIYQRLDMFDIPRRQYGVEHWSEEQKELRRRWNKEHPEIIRMKGKHHSEETKRRMSLTRQGSGNANWKGGLTKLIRGIRRSPEYYQWRKAILERDKYTCQDCKSTGEVDAHHKQSILDYPENIFEVNNGLTLCGNCHHRHTFWQKLKPKKQRTSSTTHV